MIDMENKISQRQFSDLVGVSEAAVSGMVRSGVITIGQSGAAWLKGYCSHLREMAAGRATTGDLDLATERAALAKIQRQRIELELEEKRGALIPVDLIEPRLKASVIAAREFLRGGTSNLARQAQGMNVEQLESLLEKTFDQFLTHLSKLPTSINGTDVCTLGEIDIEQEEEDE